VARVLLERSRYGCETARSAARVWAASIVKLKVDVSGLVRLNTNLLAMKEELRSKTIVAALNKVADKGKTEVDRAIRDEYVIDAARVRNAVSVRRASAKLERFEAVIDIFGSARKRGRSLNVIHFMEKKISLAQARKRAKKKELFVRGRGGQLLPILRFVFKRGAGPKTIDGVFVGNKGRTVFRRIGKGRLPIEPVQVIDVPQMFRSRKVSQRVMDRINRELPVEIQRAVRATLARIGR
jgi:hypothetical protein